MILCDTNVLIEFYKGNQKVLNVLHGIGSSSLAISVITAGELYYGARDKRELQKIQKHLSLLKQIPLDVEISMLFVDLLENFSLSHKLSIPDALIASTAICQQMPLYTLNVRDFRFIPGIELHHPR
jgi:tRNA(fMet)-specific endonuclease VapC